MNPGKYDTLITFERATPSTSPGGDVTSTWVAIARGQVWSSRKFLKGQELVEAKQIVAEVEAQFEVRFSTDVAGVVPKDRINDHGNLYDVLEIIPIPGGRPERLRVLVKRRT